ncbi:hypothetical protein GOP47_0008988 [Adiantum capillus-veneris]|uniref:Uncharacterized protein n=1 Tax=Adiantum capillus-veneris TaxID=13818 RepID=A0A9D4V0A9_ADICA|nr:hypothetical protein GOP47_0008988 [Adiantum capillus-veneris]
MATTERSCSESRKRTASAVITNPHMKGRMLRARRMSAVSKVFSKSLARGAISIDNHVESMDTAARGLRISSNLVLASVDAVAKVVEAVETGGRTLLESAGSAAAGVACEIQKNRQSDVNTFALSNLISAGWTLNKLGLLMIFRVITASMAIHSSGSSSSGSNRSGSSSSSEFRRLLSSSSSSSSLSSKSPATPSHGQGGGTTDVTSCALTLQPPAAAAAGSAMQSPPPVPPPPPLFSQNTPRIRHSNMPPPSSPLLPIAGEPSQAGLGFSDATLASTPIRIYKPRPTPAASVTGAPPPPPPSFLPRPPRFQPPPRG